MTNILDKYILAYKENIRTVKREIKNKEKISHWMWFIFPQIQGLGSIFNSIFYSFKNIEEAKLFFDNIYLRKNLTNLLQKIIEWDKSTLINFFGYLDSKKFHSSMTIFYLATNETIFEKILCKFYNQELDNNTIEILKNIG